MASSASDTPEPETTPEVEIPARDAAPVAAEPPASDPPAELDEVPPPAVSPESRPESQPTFGVGPTLRAAREAMGKSLADCSRVLRIRQPFLEALEAGRHADLPGGTYAAGFLRTYAEYLSLDGEEMVRRFRQEGSGGFTVRAELSFPSPVTEGRIPGGAVIFLGLILAVVAYGGWYALSSPETTVAEMVPPLPERLSTILSRQASLTGEETAKPAAEAAKPGEETAKPKDEVVPPPEGEEDKTAQQPRQLPPPDETTIRPEPLKTGPEKVESPETGEPPKTEPEKAAPPKVAEQPKAAEAAKPDGGTEGRVFGAENTESRVVLKAAGDDCWVQVRELDGSLLLSRLLRKGESYRVPNRPGLVLMAGNAGALEVSVDGRKGASLGAPGQVRRDIRLNPDTLLSGG